MSSESDKFFFVKDLLDSSITLASGSHESRNSDDTRFSEVDGSIGVDLSYISVTLQMESWMDE